MKKIELHPYDKDFVVEMTEFAEECIPDLLDIIKKKNKSFDGLFDKTKTLSISSYVLERNTVKSTMHLRSTMKAMLANFEKASFPGSQFEVEINKEIISVTGQASHDYNLGPGWWIEGLFLAIILKDKESILKFMNIPMNVIIGAQIGDEEIFPVYIFFLKSLLSGESNTGKLLIEAYKLTAPEFFTQERYLGYISPIVTPQLELFVEMLSNNQEGFTDALEKALLKHKLSIGDDSKTIFSLISFELVGICVLAKERGLKIEIESEYIPKFLIEGNF